MAERAGVVGESGWYRESPLRPWTEWAFLCAVTGYSLLVTGYWLLVTGYW